MQLALRIMAFVVIPLFILSCGTDSPTPGGDIDLIPLEVNPQPAPLDYDLGALTSSSFSGVVFSKDRQPLEDVIVEIHGQTTLTDTTGSFFLENINCRTNRTVVTFSKEGYFKSIHTLEPQINKTNKLSLILEEIAINEIISNQNNVISTDGATVIFPQDAFVSNDGKLLEDVEISLRAFKTDDPLFAPMVPGTDLTAIDQTGNEVFLYSYGMLQLNLPEGVGISAGKTAQIMIYNAEASTVKSIPLWYLDEETGIWVEEGIAELNNTGDFYVGEVAHFTYWNVDAPEDEPSKICITMECEGDPIEGLYFGSNQASSYTDASGQACITVRPGRSHNVFGLSDQFGDIVATEFEIPPLNPGENYNIGIANLDGYGALTGKAIACDGSPKNTNIRLRTESGDTFFANPDPVTGLFKIYVPADENIFLDIILLKETRGPFKVASCGTTDFGVIDECGDSDILPDTYSITFSSSEIPELDGFTMTRETLDDGNVYPCNQFTEVSFDEAPQQYANLVQIYISYEDQTLEGTKENNWPCLQEGVFIKMIDNDEWDVTDPILEQLGLIAINFESISGTMSYDLLADKWANGAFSVEFYIDAPGSNIDGKTVSAVGTYSIYTDR